MCVWASLGALGSVHVCSGWDHVGIMGQNELPVYLVAVKELKLPELANPIIYNIPLLQQLKP